MAAEGIGGHMKYKNYSLIIFRLVIILIFSGCGVKTEEPIFENVSTQEAAEMIKDNADNSNFVILDVRTPEEFKAGHIEGAVNLDFYSPTFKDEINKLDKAMIYFVYCRSGNRSFQAMKIMETMGFREVYNLSVGINDWVENGFPTVK